MPTLRKPKPPDPDAMFVCIGGFATQHRAIPRGTRLRGSDPIVAEHFGFFRPDGTPESEWPSEFDRVVQEAEQRAAAEADENRIRSVVLEAEQTPTRLRLVRDIVVSRPGGRVATVEAGSEAYEGDELVAATGRPNWEPVK